MADSGPLGGRTSAIGCGFSPVVCDEELAAAPGSAAAQNRLAMTSHLCCAPVFSERLPMAAAL
jgi:hypothetical protein